jgi:hypothetical protein
METTTRSNWKRRLLLIVGGVVVFLVVFVFAIRIAMMDLSGGIAAERSTALSAIAPGWDMRSMWSSSGGHSALAKQEGGNGGESWIARNADLQIRSSAFEKSVASLHRIVAGHHGYLEDLRTESRTGAGRALAATISVPTEEFDGALADLQTLGRVEVVSQAGEDSAVKLATSARHVEASKTNLTRLQKLQRERKGELRDAVALEKDIAQANESVAEAEREHEGLVSTVAQAHLRVALFEDYRAPLQVSMAGAFLQIRNSFVEGIEAILSSVCAVVGILFGYGLPVVFWVALLFWPARMAWRRWPSSPTTAVAGRFLGGL